MNLYILDNNLNELKVIDTYESFIWAERYNKSGDFELHTVVSDEILKYCKLDYFIVGSFSDRAMIIEEIKVVADIENGNHIIIKGRSLESILDRRIVWGQTTLKGNFQIAIQRLLNESIINPTDPNRKIDNFRFESSTDERITNLNIQAQFTGKSLLKVIESLCQERQLGFKITLKNKEFVFKLYAGIDRSYNQNKEPYVVFSPNFENIINSNYYESNTNMKNATLIGGEGEGKDRKYTQITLPQATGLNRRELFTDARDISSQSQSAISPTDYNNLLIQRGNEKLEKNRFVTGFEGEIEATQMFKFNKDFFNGDIVEIANEYGHSATSRITEMIISDDNNGYAVYPTFESKEKNR